MLVKRTKYSIYELAKFGIKTKYWEQYVDEEQFREGITYILGVIEQWDKDKLLGEKKCTTLDEQIEYAEYLKYKYGQMALIIIQPVEEYLHTGTLIINKDSYSTHGILDEADVETVEKWVAALSKNYDFSNELVCMWAKTNKGDLVMTGIY